MSHKCHCGCSPPLSGFINWGTSAAERGIEREERVKGRESERIEREGIARSGRTDRGGDGDDDDDDEIAYFTVR